MLILLKVFAVVVVDVVFIVVVDLNDGVVV